MAVSFRDSFQGKKVLVTGHTGFKGSWMVIWLHGLGARVSGYALAPPTDPSNFVASGVAELLEHHFEHDIRDARRVEKAIRTVDPDVIFHQAAQALVRVGYESPRETFEVNLMGTINVLDAVRSIGAPRVCVVISSDKCYENREQIWGYRENDALGGYDPYSASKGCVEVAVAATRRSYFHPDRLAAHGVKIASARAGNVIGGGDWARDRIVADVVRALAAGETVAVRNPRAVRPWQHVLEPLSGYLTLAGRMLTSDDVRWLDAWNFGPMPGTEMTVKELVDMVIARFGKGAWADVSTPHQAHEAHEAHILRLCIDRAVGELGWRPRWEPAQAVDRLARWYRDFYRNPASSMRAHCLSDISAYEDAGEIKASAASA